MSSLKSDAPLLQNSKSPAKTLRGKRSRWRSVKVEKPYPKGFMAETATLTLCFRRKRNCSHWLDFSLRRATPTQSVH
jgi:hypothetical protein